MIRSPLNSFVASRLPGRLVVSLCAFLLVVCAPAGAYNLEGYQWTQGSTTFYASIPGTAPSGIAWNDAFASAASQWNSRTNFDFNISGGSADPCAVPTGSGDRNGVMFSNTKCGSSFGGTTLAVTKNWSVGDELVQAGIIFNTHDITWDVYNTSWQGASHADFKRVAVHELGHALGLAHASGGIMSPYAGNTTVPQSDDINGVAALYGGTTSGSGGSGGSGDGGGSGGSGDSGGTGGTGGTGGSGGTGATGGTGGTGGSGGTSPPPDEIFSGSFEAPGFFSQQSPLLAEDGMVVAYDAGNHRILVHDPAVGGVKAVTVSGSGRVTPVKGDFDGDGLVDVGTFRAIDGLWTIYPGSGKPFWRYRLGGPGDVPVAADYDGDGRTDLAVWTPATGEWSIKTAVTSEPATVKLDSAATDMPAPADYTGDGRADLALWSGKSGEWRIFDLSTGVGRAYELATESAAKLEPVAGDYDGDGKADPALFDKATGTWTIRASRWAETRLYQFPDSAGALAAASDYDGDGATDAAWWAKGKLTISLSGTGEEVSRDLRDALPMNGRIGPFETNLNATNER